MVFLDGCRSFGGRFRDANPGACRTQDSGKVDGEFVEMIEDVINGRERQGTVLLCKDLGKRLF